MNDKLYAYGLLQNNCCRLKILSPLGRGGIGDLPYAILYASFVLP